MAHVSRSIPIRSLVSQHGLDSPHSSTAFTIRVVSTEKHMPDPPEMPQIDRLYNAGGGSGSDRRCALRAWATMVDRIGTP